MGYIVSTLVMGAIVWWFALGPGRKAGDSLSPLTRKLVGAVAGGAGILLALKGRWDFALVLISLGGWLLGFKLPAMFDPIGRARKSEIRTAALLVTIDLATSMMEVRILEGRFKGQSLDAIPDAVLPDVARDLAQIDAPGLSLIVQDLDRRAPGWRDHVQFDADARHGTAARGSEMREEEAYQILGLEKGAGEEAIRAAHRALIARIHPDRGGSTHLAALVNRAKDVALAAARSG